MCRNTNDSLSSSLTIEDAMFSLLISTCIGCIIFAYYEIKMYPLISFRKFP